MDDDRVPAEAQAQGKVSEILQTLSQEIHHEKAGLEFEVSECYWCRCFIAAAQRIMKKPIHKAAR